VKTSSKSRTFFPVKPLLSH